MSKPYHAPEYTEKLIKHHLGQLNRLHGEVMRPGATASDVFALGKAARGTRDFAATVWPAKRFDRWLKSVAPHLSMPSISQAMDFAVRLGRIDERLKSGSTVYPSHLEIVQAMFGKKPYEVAYGEVGVPEFRDGGRWALDAKDMRLMRYAEYGVQDEISIALARIEALLRRAPDHTTHGIVRTGCLGMKDMALAMELYCSRYLRESAFEYAPEHLVDRVREMHDSKRDVLRAAVELLEGNGSVWLSAAYCYNWKAPGEDALDPAAEVDADIVLACIQRL